MPGERCSTGEAAGGTGPTRMMPFTGPPSPLSSPSAPRSPASCLGVAATLAEERIEVVLLPEFAACVGLLDAALSLLPLPRQQRVWP